MTRIASLAVVMGVTAAGFSTAAPRAVDHCIDSRQFIHQVDPERRRVVDPRSTLAGPPPGGDHPVGAEWDWYIWSLNGFPTATLKPCTIRGKGANVYVVIENDAWNAGLVTQTDVDAVIDHYENINFTTNRVGGIHDLDVEAFGPPPLGLDGDPRVYLLYYDFDISSDGFFWVFDTEPDGANPPFSSNETEVLYLNCGPDAGVDHSPAGPYMIGVVAHELEHLIHHAYDPDEDSWVDEGLAEFAMYYYGADDPGWIASFLGNPDTALIPPSGSGPHYGAVWFWTVYLANQYGMTNLTQALVNEPANGIAGVDGALQTLGFTQRFTDVFNDWVVANLLDDPAPGIQYSYPEYDFAPITIGATHATYPLASTPGSVRLWAADYVRFTSYGSVTVSFDGSVQAPYEFALSFIEIDDDAVLPPRVNWVPVDAQQDGSFLSSSAGGYESLVLIPAVTSANPGATTSSRSYSYSADALPPIAPLVLYATKVPGAPTLDVELTWSGGASPYDLYRAIDRTLIGDPGQLEQSNVMSPHTVLNELGAEVYYWIE